MSLVLAGGASEVQTGLHQSFPGPAARAGAEDAGEEGAGGHGGHAVGPRCSQAQESPQRPHYLSERYCASSHPHLSQPLCCPLSQCSCGGCWPHDQTHTHTEQKARRAVFSQYMLFFEGYTSVFGFCSIMLLLKELINSLKSFAESQNCELAAVSDKTIHHSYSIPGKLRFCATIKVS